MVSTLLAQTLKLPVHFLSTNKLFISESSPQKIADRKAS